MSLSIIAALAKQNVIGYQNKLPWHLPADLRHFKELTRGKPIIMGRKTYESIGKPLPERLNIIITRDTSYKAEGCLIAHSFNEAIELTRDTAEIMVIGGTEIFRHALPLAQKLYLTFIDADIEGDVFFPQWSIDEWNELQRETFNPNEKNPYPYSFVTFERKIKSFKDNT
ncbi:MAG: IS1595 family transposase ISSsu9 [Legionellaceae bacterium]